uniref:SFRICE_024122 n=1 Tax=Spodoptera frugiperda TaxID=7108 RepID=A0A2H1WSW1_SPOFR
MSGQPAAHDNRAQTYAHTDLEQKFVDHTKICSRESNALHVARQPVTQPPCSQNFKVEHYILLCYIMLIKHHTRLVVLGSDIELDQ